MDITCEKIIDILENMKQDDYELWIRTVGYSHLSEEQWEWLIRNFKEHLKEQLLWLS